MPIRSDVYRIGPGLVSFTAIAITAMNGDRMTSAVAEPSRSTKSLPNFFAPSYCGLSTCSSGSPPIGRICIRGPATSTTPGETTRSVWLASSCQASARIPSVPRNSALLTATTSAPVASIAASTEVSSPSTGTVWPPMFTTGLPALDQPGSQTPTTR